MKMNAMIDLLNEDYVPCHECVYQPDPGSICAAPCRRIIEYTGNCDIRKVRGEV